MREPRLPQQSSRTCFRKHSKNAIAKRYQGVLWNAHSLPEMQPAQPVTSFYQRGGLWVLAQGALLFVVIFLAARVRGRARRPVVVFTGAALLGLGAGVIVAGVVALGRNLTPFPKPPENAQLVRRGIFSLIRHPIYSGVMLMSAGWAQLWQSWPALATAMGLIPFFAAKARREEYWLRKRFPEYASYERQVNRFIPRIY
jgi:protein-S-isoprenylcysteine O-methyltransferase Ste14